jgi:DNA-binding NarL/FixJ family response regulator
LKPQARATGRLRKCPGNRHSWTVNSPEQIRVLVGEDQPFVREGILRVLEEGGFDVVGTAGDARDLVRMADAYRPDVIIADIQMPPKHGDDGLRAALAIRAAQPGTGVLVLSQFLEDAYAFALVADGAQGVGYLLKEKVGDLRAFTDAVQRVADGGSVLDPEVVTRLVGRKRKAGPLDSLTPREREVLGLIAEGRSNSGIAAELVVTVAAVERHVTSIFDKLGLGHSPDSHRRVLAVLTYLQA